MSNKPRAVLFDLDGTLLDTAPDLAAALNRVRREDGLEELPYATIRPHVSNGSIALIRLGYEYPEDSDEFLSRRQRLLDAYHDKVAALSQLFNGMPEVLAHIESSARPWGIVTNKPAWLTTPLLAAIDLDKRPACVISGDTTSNAKPHPEPLLTAAAALNLAPSDCLYVGDAQRDVQAAQAANMPVLIALYGYIPDHDDPSRWGGDGVIDQPAELIEWL